VFDAIRAAYDLGYCDKQNGMVSAAREVEMDHGAALISSLESIAYLQAAQAAPADRLGSVRCPRCWEMMSVPAAPAPVPLTDEQIVALAREVLEQPTQDGKPAAWQLAEGIARAIERAHGIAANKGGEA